MMKDRTEAQDSKPESDWNRLSSLFHLNALRYPDQTALVIPPGLDRPYRHTLTYEELDLLASGYADHFGPLGVEEQIIAILVPRSSEHLWAAQIGSLRAGFAYTCIDPNLPDEVLRRTLLDAAPSAVVVDPHLDRRLRSCLESDCLVLVTSEVHPAESVTEHSDVPSGRLAYLIYTSGTSGLPKGVMIEERSIINLVRSDIHEFGLGIGDKVAQGSSASYDSSVEETWLAFGVGATLVVMDDDTARLGPDLVDWLRDEQITVLCPPPTLLRTMGCENPERALPQLRLLYVGGEALTPDVANAWAPGRRLVNGYGPTESTVTCIRTDIVENGAITIGKPVPGVTAFVLREDDSDANVGEKGELCLGGIGLARGYRNSPEITAQKFIQHPIHGRIYRTGDLVQWESDGNLSYFGRIDAQIKLRGYRIELEAIEAVIATYPGVLETACRLQREGSREWLSAHIVLEDPSCQLDSVHLRDHIGSQLPSYMVPTAFALTESLPKSVGGKLKRDALPFVVPHFAHAKRDLVLPRTEIEALVIRACVDVFGNDEPISIEDDFFTDLGGTSLLASRMVTALRANSQTASVTVRDIYEGRTIGGIAARTKGAKQVAQRNTAEVRRGNPAFATLIQSLFLLLEFAVGSTAFTWLIFGGVAWFDKFYNVAALFVIWPLLAWIGLLVYTPIAVTIAVLAKKVLIGKYQPGSEPIWGSFFIKNWIVRQCVRLIPWRQLEGTEFACMALRALGAQIGRDVHFHHGSLPLLGGWDLIKVGDEVSICQDAVLNVLDLEAGQIVLGTVELGDRAVVETRAIVGPNSKMGSEAILKPLSHLTPGDVVPSREIWNGVPAVRTGLAPDISSAAAHNLSPITYSGLLMLAKTVLGFLQFLPFQIAFWLTYSLVPNGKNGPGLMGWFGICALICAICMPLLVAMEALSCRMLGRILPGTIPLRSFQFIKVWIKALMVEGSGRWLSGTLYWPVWLRMAGMNLGRDCEISTIIDVTPELVTIGEHVFFADGIYLGTPEIRAGNVTLAPLTVSPNSFMGNHVVLPGGQSLPPDILLGVCTVADDSVITPGSSWFGLPAMELLQREIVKVDESLISKPTPIRYWNRVFWETLRFFVPTVPFFSFYLWWTWLQEASSWMTDPMRFIVGATGVSLVIAALLCLTVLGLKWLLLGKVKEGIHPLWSCWCSRWDFLYVAWGEWAAPILERLEGSLLLIPYLRAMGMKIGKRVAFGDGFAQVVDPDMIVIEDDATIGANYQAHTFEDRVLKIGKVIVNRGATLGRSVVPLYGSVVGEHTVVEPNSVIMKHEHLLPGCRYQGSPSRPVESET